MMHKAELKRFVRSFLVYGIGGILQKFMGLLLLPMFTRVLTPEDYGALALVGFVATAMSGLFTLGTGNSMGLLYFKAEASDRRVRVIWTTALLMAGNGTMLTCLLCLAADSISSLVFESPAYADLIRLTFVSLAISAVTDPFLAYLRMEEQAKQYVLLTLASAFISILLGAFLVLWLKWGIMGAALAGVVSGAITFVAVLLLVVKRLPLRIDSALFLPLIRIGFPSIFGVFAFMLIDYADRQLLQRMAGLEALGVYSVGYNFGMAIMIFVGAFSTAWPPFFMSFFNRQDEARTLFGKILRYYLIAFGLLSVGFFAAARPLVMLLAGDQFQEAFVVVGMVAAAYALKGCYLILLPGLYFKNRLIVQSGIEWIAALINLGLNFVWIPTFGIVGAAAATLLGYVSLPVCTWLVSRHCLRVDYDKFRMSAVVAILIFACALLWAMSFGSQPLFAMGMAAAVTLVVLMLLIGGGLSAEERVAGIRAVRSFFRGAPVGV